MRIIGGERKGHRIKVPPCGDVRPTSERVREAIFSAVGGLSGLAVLDLFAGSGAMGLESLSRGAASCVFVEGDHRVAAVLRENILKLDYAGSTRVLVVDYARALAVLAGSEAFDLIFVDPPYRLLPQVQKVLTSNLPRMLRSGGLVVVEGPRGTRVDLGLEIVFARRYGDTLVTMAIEGAEVK